MRDWKSTVVERILRKRKPTGGRREGAGRKPGGIPERKRVARALAAREGKLPHELLLEWSRTGVMRYGSKTVRLEPSDRIACAKGCASWYKAPMAATRAPDEQPPVFRLEVDEKMLAALARDRPDKLEVLRDVLRAMQTGGVDMAQMTAGVSQRAVDPSRYGRMLTEASAVEGSA